MGTVLRLGKAAENVVDILEKNGGWMSLPDLAADLGLKRSRDLRRRTLPRLEDAAVVECSGDDLRLRLDWQAALKRKRKDDQEIDDKERDEKKYAEESRVFALKVEARKLERVCGLEEIASRLEIGTEDVRRLLNIERPAEPEPAPVEPDGFIEDLERVEDPTEPDTPVRKSNPSPKIEVVEEPIHDLSCECDDCLFPSPRYARLWRSPRVRDRDGAKELVAV